MYFRRGGTKKINNRRGEKKKKISLETDNTSMAPSSSSGLTFKLHPLVMLNISDHFTRVKTQLNPPASSCANGNNPSTGDATLLPQDFRVYGCVIGAQKGRTVEIFNSFELLLDPTTDTLDRSFLEKKQELCKGFFFFFFKLSLSRLCFGLNRFDFCLGV